MAAPVPPKPAQDPTTKASAGSFGAPGSRPERGVFPLRVHAAWDETPTLRGLLLRGPAALVRQYQTPGQYLELMHAEAGSGYFALAAAPALAAATAEPTAAETGELELLVRRGPGLAGVLAGLPPDAGPVVARGDRAGAPGAESTLTLPEDAPLRTHGVRGAGFALAAQAGRDLLLVAAGSGIAPLRAVLQVLKQQRQRFGRIALYYGERVEADFAYRRELQALREADVAIELVLTRPPADWPGGTGYVQTHLRALPPAWLGPDTAVLLCGQPAMISEVTTTLTQHRVPPSQILLNY